MTLLDKKFVDNARTTPVEFQHGTNVVWFSSSDATAGEGRLAGAAVLEVTMDNQVIGYITGKGDTEHGVISEDRFGEDPPAAFHTLEGALEQLLPGVADGLAEKPTL